MEIVTDISIAEKTVKRLLKRLENEPVDICPGYNAGLVLPADTPIGVIITTPVSKLLPLCKPDNQSDLSVYFMIYPEGKFTPLFEISWKKSGQYVYKNNKKFVNPPRFDELFTKMRNIYKEKIADLIRNNTEQAKADILSYRCHTLIFKCLKANMVKG